MQRRLLLKLLLVVSMLGVMLGTTVDTVFGQVVMPPGGGSTGGTTTGGSTGGSTGGPTGGSTGGTGGNWQITYDHTGSTLWLDSWTITGQPGSQTKAEKHTEMIAATNGGVLSGHTLSFSAGGSAYQPGPGLDFVSLSCVGRATLKTKTKVKWVGQGAAPATVKLAIYAKGAAGYNYGSGVIDAANGLGHEPVVNEGQTWMGGPPPYGTWMPYGSVLSEGTRYREFSLDQNGEVQFNTTTTAFALGYGNWSVTAKISVVPTNWSVDVVADRDETFRRVVRGTSVVPVSNYFEDDGVTAKGGNGTKEGDSVATEPNFWNGNQRDFSCLFDLITNGPWSGSTTSTLTASGVSYTDLITGHKIHAFYEEIPASASQPLRTFTVTGSATDPVNSISDAMTYTMRVHLFAEKMSLLATFDTDFLYWAKDDPNFTDYHAEVHVPKKWFSRSNGTSLPVTESYKVTNTISATLGYEYTREVGAELPLEIAKILFNDKFTVSGEFKVEKTTEQSTSFSVPPNSRLEVWEVTRGNLKKWLTARYGEHGYTGDAHEFTLDQYTVEDFFWERPLNAPIRAPHTSDHAGT